MSEEIINNTEETLPNGVVKITAEDGYVYTDPNHQIVGKTLYVLEEIKDTFVQVTEEEGQEIQEQITQSINEKMNAFKERFNK